MQQIQKPISEFLTGRIAPTVWADTTVMDTVAIMTSEHCDCVLVVDDKDIIGIFTDRDFLNRVAGVGLNPVETPMRDVMTTDLELLRETDCVSYALEKMASRGIRNIPIITESGSPAVLTVWDVMSHLSEVLEEVKEAEVDEDILDEWTDIGGG